MKLFIIIVQILIVPIASPLGIGIVKKIKATLQNRRGAGVFQPYKDIWKLLNKDEVISADASWIFKFAPLHCLFGFTRSWGIHPDHRLISALCNAR